MIWIRNNLRRTKMIKFLIGFILGANISLFLYALILYGSRADKKAERKEEKIE